MPTPEAWVRHAAAAERDRRQRRQLREEHGRFGSAVPKRHDLAPPPPRAVPPPAVPPRPPKDREVA